MTVVTRYPTTQTGSWTDGANLLANDSSYATAIPAKYGHVYHYAYDFGFNIPTGATINSITIEISRRLSTTASNGGMYFRCMKNNANYGTEAYDSSEPTTDTIVSTTNNGTWTVAELNAGGINGFQVKIDEYRANSSTEKTAYVNFIRVSVDYTATTESYNGSFAVSQASTVTATANKKASAVLSVSQASTVAQVGRKISNGLVSISQASSVVFDGVVGTLEKIGAFAISQASSVAVIGGKVVNSVLSVGQDSSVTASAVKESLSAFAITQGQAVSTVGGKISQAVSSIAQSDVVSSIGDKITSAVLLVEQASSVVIDGVKGAVIENKIGEFLIEQLHSISAIGKKRNTATTTITEGTELTSNGGKGSIGRIGIATSDIINIGGKKIANGLGYISALCSISYIWWTDQVLVSPLSANMALGNFSTSSVSIGNLSTGTATVERIKQSTEFGNISRENIEYDTN